MTDKIAATASTEAKPKEGEILLYIDWQGKKVYGQPDHKHATKKGEK